jgi:aldehyde dehydrogenase (NAD+)
LELTPLISETLKTIKEVPKWAAPEKAPFSFNWFAMRPVTRKEVRRPTLLILLVSHPLTAAYACAAQGRGAHHRPVQLPVLPHPRTARASPLSLLRAPVVRLVSRAPSETQIGAIAAGNACVIKPSEATPHCSQLLADMISKYARVPLLLFPSRRTDGSRAELTRASVRPPA